MRIALVLTPPTEHHFRLAAQVGADDFVARYQSVDTFEKMQHTQTVAAGFGLKLSVVEGYLPMGEIIRGTEKRDAQIEEVKTVIQNMGRLKIPLLCYNWMQSDWTRTCFEKPERGGALTNGFDITQLAGKSLPEAERLSSAQMWENLEYFLSRVLPVAEAEGIQLAMHPDDPPLPELLGASQIMYQPESFEKLFEMFPNPANGMCFCQGSFVEMGAEMGVDIPSTIRRFGDRIRYVHFRDVRGNASRFVETFHDNGPTDMYAAMRAYKEIGFAGTMRPDHVPLMDGEEGRADGYSMLGRLFAVGYMRGLMHAVAREEEYSDYGN